jgi:hypothetical protein
MSRAIWTIYADMLSPHVGFFKFRSSNVLNLHYIETSSLIGGENFLHEKDIKFIFVGSKFSKGK